MTRLTGKLPRNFIKDSYYVGNVAAGPLFPDIKTPATDSGHDRGQVFGAVTRKPGEDIRKES
jgi:hypothetical protein